MRNRRRARRCARGAAFTLVEMLAVTVIIGILMSLLSLAVFSALSMGKEAVLAFEVRELSSAFEQFKNKYGDYPPADLRNADDPNSAINQFCRRAFYRYAGDDAQLKADILTRLNQLTGAGAADITSFEPAQALVFWLSGFSPDPTQPFTGAGTYDAYYDFESARLAEGKFLAPGKNLIADANGNNVWDSGELYKDEKAYLYIDRRSYGVDYNHNNGVFRAYQGVNANSYQIICSGLDEDYGTGNITYPAGPFPGGDKDNLTNFSGGKTLYDATDQ